MNYSEKLYQSYAKDRKDFLDRDKHQKLLKKYMEINYKRFCPIETKRIRVLEIGSNDGTGYVWLSEVYSKMEYTGIDLSPEDVNIARKSTGKDVFFLEDAFNYLSNHKEEFNLIVMRAVLEHISKSGVMELLELIKKALSNGGYLLWMCPIWTGF